MLSHYLTLHGGTAVNAPYSRIVINEPRVQERSPVSSPLGSLYDDVGAVYVC